MESAIGGDAAFAGNGGAGRPPASDIGFGCGAVARANRDRARDRADDDRTGFARGAIATATRRSFGECICSRGVRRTLVLATSRCGFHVLRAGVRVLGIAVTNTMPVSAATGAPVFLAAK